MNRGISLVVGLLLLAPLQVFAQATHDATSLPPVNAPPPPPLPPLDRRQRPDDPDNSLSAPVPRPDDAGDAPLPPKARPSDELVPGVVIRADDSGQIVEEYSVNGRIYMVRVTPTIGPVYYLFDVDGDGEMETREFESDPGIKPVHWKILEWD